MAMPMRRYRAYNGLLFTNNALTLSSVTVNAYIPSAGATRLRR
jgi:hypothetical protein